MAQTRVGRVEDFADGVVQVFELDVGPVAVVAWEGCFHAFANRCTHNGSTFEHARLTNGEVIICRSHYAVFELDTGRAIDGPTWTDLPVFEIVLQGKDVLVTT